ncbi:hypothetical protein F5Y04DRAFT_291732 [Hypomontagnella monticulosa]|nr:hypothetical protein F5Y04DRAFT_291732 [Hypomontagnella monticulosa]
MLHLKKYLPRSGMVYGPGDGFLRRRWQAKRVMTGLRQAGIISVNHFYDEPDKQAVDQAMANVFNNAPRALQYAIANNDDFDCFLNALKASVPWAQDCSDSTFYQFCGRLVMARDKWHKYHVSSLYQTGNSEMAKSIDRMMETIKGHFDVTNFALWAEWDLFRSVDADKPEDEVYGPADHDCTDDGNWGPDTVMAIR